MQSHLAATITQTAGHLLEGAGIVGNVSDSLLVMKDITVVQLSAQDNHLLAEPAVGGSTLVTLAVSSGSSLKLYKHVVVRNGELHTFDISPERAIAMLRSPSSPTTVPHDGMDTPSQSRQQQQQHVWYDNRVESSTETGPDGKKKTVVVTASAATREWVHDVGNGQAFVRHHQSSTTTESSSRNCAVS